MASAVIKADDVACVVNDLSKLWRDGHGEVNAVALAARGMPAPLAAAVLSRLRFVGQVELARHLDVERGANVGS